MSASQPRETRVLELDCTNRDGQLFKLKTGKIDSEKNMSSATKYKEKICVAIKKIYEMSGCYVHCA